MAFKGITFAGQNVTPKNDGGLYQAHHGDGILWGCSMNISGDDLVIQSGEFIMGGRVVQVDGATNVDLSGRSLTTGYIQVIMNADLSQGEGSQWYTSFVESATTTFPALTQGNINDTDTLYQLELAVIQISGGNLTNVYSSLALSNIKTPNIVLTDANGDTQAEVVYTNNGDLDIYANGNNGIRIAYDGKVYIYADTNDIYMRPNGLFNTTGQIHLGTDGQLLGGFPFVVSTSGGSVSATVGDWKTIYTISGLDGGATYFLFGQINGRHTASGNNVSHIAFGPSASTHALGQTAFINNTNSVYNQVCGFYSGVSSLRFDVYANTAFTVSSWSLYVIRINA